MKIYKKRTYRLFISLGHCCNDINTGALTSILPFLIATYNYNYAIASSLVFVSNIVGSIVQPIFGEMADKKNIPVTMAIGIMLTGLGMGMTGFVHKYWALCICVIVSGIGSAMFHPQAVRLLNKLSDKNKTGSAISIFSFGGNLGFGLGPVLITATITLVGLKGTGVLFIPALISSAILVSQSKRFTDKGLEELDKNQLEAENANTMTSQAKTLPPDQWKSFAILSIFICSRSIILNGITTFCSLYFINILNQTTAFGNAMLTLYSFVSMTTALYGGLLADKIGYNQIIKIAMLLLAGSVALFSISRNIYLCVLLLFPMATGANLSYSPLVVLGQMYLPNHLGLSSGMTLVLSISVGGIFAPILGMIGDNYDLNVTFYVITAISVIPLIISMILPKPIT